MPRTQRRSAALALGLAVASTGLALALVSTGAVPTTTAQLALPNIYQYSIAGFQYAPGLMAGVRDVAVGPDGDVYVVDGINQRIQRFSPDGDVVAIWGRGGIGEGELDEPRGIDVAPDGTVWVAESGYASRGILRFDGEGRYLGRLEGAYGPWPLDVAVAPDGSVCMSQEDSVVCYDAEGERAAWWSTAEGEDYLTNVEPIAIDAEGLVYVLDDENNKIKVYRTDGGLVRAWGMPRTAADKYRGVKSMALHPDGTIHVGDIKNDEVLRFDRMGTLLGTWPAHASSLAIDPQGRAFVVDDETQVLRRYGPDAVREIEWGGRDPERAAFRSPEALAFAPDGTLYVTDIDWDVVHHVDRLGRYLGRLGRPDLDAAGDLADPYGVAVTSDGSVLVTDLRRNRVLQYAPDGSLGASWDIGRDPMGIDLAADDTAFVITNQSNAVLHLGPAGEVVLGWGSAGSAPGRFESPTGIDVAPDGSILVADWGNDRVQRFSPEGLFLNAWGESGSELGQFDGLANLSTRQDGSVLTVETYNHRIQYFDADGKSLGSWTSNAQAQARHRHSVNIDIAEGPEGRIYVADRTTGEIEIFDTHYADVWYTQYFNNRWLAGRSADAAFVLEADFDWGEAAPMPGLPSDDFSIRLFRYVHFAEGGHRFRLSAAGGARLWVNKRLLIDGYADADVDASGEIWLEEGGHNLRLEYNDPGGPAALHLEWESVDLPTPSPSPTPRATPTRSGPPPATCCGRVHLPVLWAGG